MSFDPLYRILCGPDAADLSGGGGDSVADSTSAVDSGGIADSAGDSAASLSPDNDFGGTTQPAAPDPAATAASAAQWTSIREAASALGLDLSSHQDDRQALNYLIEQTRGRRQDDFYANLGRQIAPYGQTVSQAIQAQRNPEPEAPPAWQPPAYDQRWLALVERDPSTGVFIPKGQGVPPEVVQAINARAEWEQKFHEDPAGFLQPFVEQRAGAIADERINARLQEMQTQQARNQILSSNADWLYAKDQAGRTTNTLSPLGTVYAQSLRSLEQSGVTDPYRLDHLARQLTRAAVLEQQSASAPNPAAQTQAAFATGHPNVNPLQAQPPQMRRGNPAATEPTATGMSLRQVLQRNMEAAGVTDADFASVN